VGERGPEAKKKKAKTPPKVNPAEDLVDRWLDLVGDLERSLDQQPDALQQTLDAAAHLFAMRWPKKGEQTYTYKRRRLKVLARQRRDLFDALERTGLIAAHHG